MTLTPLSIPDLLKSHSLRARKELGQNFLTDPVALERILAAADIPAGAAVLEIGPGLGSLTRYLALAAQRVVAVELDRDLAEILKDVISGTDNVTVVLGDILDQDPAELMGADGYLVVANIPYYITSVIIRHLLEARLKPARIVLTIQREVAERICATPGDMSLLALSVQVYGKPSIAARIPAGAFYPPPKVDSAVVRVDLYPQPLIPAEKMDVFFRLIKAGFSQKRKTLRNSLTGGLAWKREQVEAMLTAAGIDAMRRAETLSLDEWNRMVEHYPSAHVSAATQE